MKTTVKIWAILAIAGVFAVTICTFHTSQADQTEGVKINSTGEFGSDPAGAGKFDRELMMKGDKAAQQVVHPKNAKTLQGEVGETPVVNADLTISETQAAKVADAKDVVRGQANIFIRVMGTYVGAGGAGGIVKMWQTDYNRGVHIVLEINTSSIEDNFVAMDKRWTELDVRLINGATGTTYTVNTFSIVGNGTLDFVGSEVSVTTNAPVASIRLKGTKEGAVTINAQANNNATVISATGQVVKAIKTPHGDPTIDPTTPVDAGPNNTNEIVFSTAAAGVATVIAEAYRVVKDPAKLWWYIDDGQSPAKWNPHVLTTDKMGQGLNPTATYTGLPDTNLGFGLKRINLVMQEDTVFPIKQNFELFFPRDATNHPGGQAGSPNWFYYWGQVYVHNNTHYVANLGGNWLTTPAMYDWQYNVQPDKTRINISDDVLRKDRAYGVGEEMSGIDMYVYCVIHEEKHIAQITAADALLATNGNDAFRYGWSWNQAAHNHWTKGPDGQWGVAGQDDDSNHIIDDAAVSPPFEPGNGDDINLGHPVWREWPNAWPLPNPLNGLHPIEAEAVNAADAAMNENDYARKDWGSPGKNRRTLNKWDD